MLLIEIVLFFLLVLLMINKDEQFLLHFSVTIFFILLLQITYFSYEEYSLFKKDKLHLISPKNKFSFYNAASVINILTIYYLMYQNRESYIDNHFTSFLLTSLLPVPKMIYAKRKQAIYFNEKKIFLPYIFEPDIEFREISGIELEHEKCHLYIDKIDNTTLTLKFSKDEMENQKDQILKLISHYTSY